MNVSKPLQEFFAAEIRNEDEGGVRPATLTSALDSWRQAPEDILFEWMGLSWPAEGQEGDDQVECQLDQSEGELRQLIKSLGPHTLLETLIDQ